MTSTSSTDSPVSSSSPPEKLDLRKLLAGLKMQGICPYCKKVFGEATNKKEMHSLYEEHLKACPVALKEAKEAKESAQSLERIIKISDSAGVSRKDLFRILAGDQVVRDIKKVMKKYDLTLEELQEYIERMEIDE